MSINNNEEVKRSKDLTVNYSSLTEEEKEILKLEFNLSPCNIWGYLIELEARIKTLESESRLKEVK